MYGVFHYNLAIPLLHVSVTWNVVKIHGEDMIINTETEHATHQYFILIYIPFLYFIII